MRLSLQDRRVGDVTIVTCRGAIVAGTESAALLKHIEALIPTSPHILLHLGDIEFIDSSGLGLLVRCLTRVQNAYGQLNVCALSRKVSDALRVTRLESVFKPYYTEADAITDVHRATRTEDVSPLSARVLCVDSSPDVLAYLRELLKEAGCRVITAENLPDGLILLTATQPKVVVIGAELRAAGGTRAAEEFHRRAATPGLIVLPPDFSTHEAGEAARELLGEIRAILDAGNTPATMV